MTDSTKRAEDFFAANPGQQYVATRGAVYERHGGVTSRTPWPVRVTPEPTAAPARPPELPGTP